MDYKKSIQAVTQSQYIGFEELLEIIESIYGDESDDGTMSMEPSKIEEILIKILGKDGKNMAVSVYNSSQLQEVFTWKYHVTTGEGYLSERIK